MNLRAPNMLLFAVLAAGILAIGAIACSGDDDDDGTVEISEVTIVANDYQFDAPTSIPGGLTRIPFRNAAPAEDHQAQLLRLNDGVTLDDFTATLADPDSGEAELFALVEAAVGGPGAGPGGENENVVNLEEGTYLLVCFIPSPTDGIPHAAKGMVQQLDVTAVPDEQPEPLNVDVSVGLADFAFDAPETLAAGETAIEVTNNGTQEHEMAVFSLDEGITTEDVVAILTGEVEPQGPPPFAFTGQVAIMPPGQSGITTIDLKPGPYALLCFVTDP